MKNHKILYLMFITIVYLSCIVVGSEAYNGANDAVLLQGFHWESNLYHWYQILYEKTPEIRSGGFDYVWFPPPTSTSDRQGYLPNQWYELNTRYGTKNELVRVIQALKSGHPDELPAVNLRPVGAIADIVVNHRCGRHGWADFVDPNFAPPGTSDTTLVTQANNQAICKDDEWANSNGAPTGGSDSGDGFHAGRDLDHANVHVQREIKRWLNWLKNEIGFSGWRWDMVKGYHANYVGLYNDGSQPAISIGEYWSNGRQEVTDWINRTMGLPDDSAGNPNRSGGKSAAFDFPTRDLLRTAVIRNDYSGLKTIGGKPTGLIGWWGPMAVTFIENHDTEYGHLHDCHESFPGNQIMLGYTYILTHPGKPCVFWKHYFDWGDDYRGEIKKLISLRKTSGLNADSTVNIREARAGLYAAVIDDKVAMKIGNENWQPTNGQWQLVMSGDNYAVWKK